MQTLDRDALRDAIRDEYGQVALNPERGFHFHTGRPLTRLLEYPDAWLEGVPESAIESFAGTGNPFQLGELRPGERVIDLGCGAGMDSFVAARQVGARGRVLGVDMTPEMLLKASHARDEAGVGQLEFRQGYLEEVPAEDGWADVVISNGVVNLCPDKRAVFREIFRVLRPGGRLQIGDIAIDKPISKESRLRADLWTG